MENALNPQIMSNFKASKKPFEVGTIDNVVQDKVKERKPDLRQLAVEGPKSNNLEVKVL